MEPPSKHLLETLQKLQLCSAADLRACRPRVRRLARDLPAFDSVWIDALLQIGRITLFQAEALQRSQSEQLRIGPCILLERLGHSRFASTYLGQRVGGVERCALKIMSVGPDQLSDRQQRLQTVIRNLSGWQHPAIVAPHQCLVHEGELVALSRPVTGPNLRDLLVRRGRFPAEVVVDLAGQLIEGLAHLEARGEVHGDVRLNNVRLTDSGQAVLVDAAIAPAVLPELTIHAALPPHRYDGAAPELIGTGRSPTSRSDLYSLGCLLWELLAGRPPFPTGDSLGKLVSHQTRPVPDVRTWAPDTPDRLAEAIRVFTARHPDDRPRSFRDVQSRWESNGARQRRRLLRFRSRFSTSAPGHVSSTVPGGGYWTTIVAVFVLMSGLSLTLLDRNARSAVLAFGGNAVRWSGVEKPVEGDALPPTDRTGGVSVENERPPALTSAPKAMPLPDASGVIALPDAGPWEAATIALAGPLTIRGPAMALAEIQVAGNPLELRSERVKLENVRLCFRRPAGVGSDLSANASSSATAATRGTSLLVVRSRDLILRRCEFEGRLDAADRPDSEPERSVAVRWSPLNATDPRGGRVLVQDSVFFAATAVAAEAPPRELVLRNVLAQHAASFIRLSSLTVPGGSCRVDAARLTLRDAGAFVRLPAALGSGPLRIDVEATDCVFDLRPKESALVCLEGAPTSERWFEAMEWNGEGNLVPLEMTVAGVATETGSMQPLEASKLAIDGLLSCRYEFAGATSRRPADSAVLSCEAPRRSAAPPGIDASHLGSGAHVVRTAAGGR